MYPMTHPISPYRPRTAGHSFSLGDRVRERDMGSGTVVGFGGLTGDPAEVKSNHRLVCLMEAEWLTADGEEV